MKALTKYLIFFMLSVISAINITCNTISEGNRSNSQHYIILKPPPPPLLPKIDFQSYCKVLKEHNLNDATDENLYIITNNIDFQNRIVFEKIMHDKYHLLVRPILNAMDTICIKPILDSIIKARLKVNDVQEIISDVQKDVSALQEKIGQYQVDIGTYFVSDTFPKYIKGMNQLYADISTLRKSHKRDSKKKGRVMFYYKIDTLGKITDISVFEHVDKETDSISISIFKQLPGIWSPGIVNNHPVSFWSQYAIDW